MVCARSEIEKKLMENNLKIMRLNQEVMEIYSIVKCCKFS